MQIKLIKQIRWCFCIRGLLTRRDLMESFSVITNFIKQMIEHFWKVFFSNKNNFSICEELPLRPLLQLFPFRTNRKQKRLQRRDGRLDLDCKQDVGIPIFGTQTSGGAHVSCMWVCQGLGAFFRWMTVRNPQTLVGLISGWVDSGILFLKFVQIRKV